MTYMEDVNSMTTDFHDYIEEVLLVTDSIQLDDNLSDKLWEFLQTFLEEVYDYPMYKNHN